MVEDGPLFLDNRAKITAIPSTRQKTLFTILTEAKIAIFHVPFPDIHGEGEIDQIRPTLIRDYGLNGGSAKMEEGGL